MAVQYKELDEWGGMVLTEYSDDIDGRLVLPETVDGKPLVAVGEKVFQSRAGLEEVVIPNTVKIIGKKAFLDCRNLKKVVLSENLEVIGWGALGCCPLVKCHLPASLKEIQTGAFCQSCIEEITLPASCTVLGNVVFCECKRLRAITVEEDNPAYASYDGVLYNKRGTCLIQYPPEREAVVYEVREGTEEIAEQAFINNQRIEMLILPASLKNISQDAFDVCRSLQIIWYQGSWSQWKRIKGASYALHWCQDARIKYLLDE